MLRSIAIGFAIAALVQVGALTAASTGTFPSADSLRGTVLDCASDTVSRVISGTFALLAR